MEEGPTIGKITIDPGVLETIARLTALVVPGVVRLTPPGGLQRLLKKENGVEIVVEGDSVRVDLYVVAASGKNLLLLGRQLQSEVSRAIHEIVGMQVESVNVHVEDVVPEPNP